MPKNLARRNISTNTPSEKRVGYSRAVEINGRLYLSGTTSQDETGNIHGKTVLEQTTYIFDKLCKVLDLAGYSVKDVVLVRAYLVDMDGLSGFDKAFKSEFSEVYPACTLVGVNSLVDPKMLVEIEYIADKGK